MANIEKLLQKEQKEREQMEKHKQAADRLKKEIEYQQSQEVSRCVNRLNLTADQYKGFLAMLNDKESLLSAIEHIKPVEERKDMYDDNSKVETERV